MGSHRYWRVIGMEAYGSGDLEISAFYLLDAASERLDSAAIISTSVPPYAGNVLNLQDGNVETTTHWLSSVLPSLVLTWDFGDIPADVRNIQLIGNNHIRFPLVIRLQYFDGTLWVDYDTVSGISWPGNGVPTVVMTLPVIMGEASAIYEFNETDGTVMYDSSPYARHGTYLGALPTTPSLISGGGDRALRISPNEYHIIPNSACSVGSALSVTFIIQYTTPNNLVVLERGSNNNFSIQTFASINFGYQVPDGTIGFTAGATSAAAVAVSNIAFNDGLPHVVSMIYGASLSQCYVIVDGVDVTYRKVYRTVEADGVNWQVGSRSGTYGFGGAMDRVSFHEHALSLSDVVTMHYILMNSRKLLIRQNTVRGRVTSYDSITLPIGAGGLTSYGMIHKNETINMTVDSGSMRDYNTGLLGHGIGRISGTIKKTGTPNTPYYSKVRLVRERDGLLIREIWSDPITGNYSFDYIDELQKFTVLSYDHSGEFNAVISSGNIPEIIN